MVLYLYVYPCLIFTPLLCLIFLFFPLLHTRAVVKCVSVPLVSLCVSVNYYFKFSHTQSLSFYTVRLSPARYLALLPSSFPPQAGRLQTLLLLLLQYTPRMYSVSPKLREREHLVVYRAVIGLSSKFVGAPQHALTNVQYDHLKLLPDPALIVVATRHYMSPMFT